MIFPKKLYDHLKFLALVLLPALGTLYFALAGLWGLPAADQVVGTVLAVDTFLGVLLHLSSLKYDRSDEKYNGRLDVLPNENGGKKFQLTLDHDPEELEHHEAITFKVMRPAGELMYMARH